MEAYAFFNNNIIEQYTYDDSVVDGVNVSSRTYRIITDVPSHGGTIEEGTDVKPLEVVLFMKDVISDVPYTQMKGRGCRVINDDKLKEVTPNADTKECYYIVDAVGVTEHEKYIPQSVQTPGGKYCVNIL